MKKRYVLVGAGGRASLYIAALSNDFSEYGELVALCDSNPGRMAFWRERIVKTLGGKAPELYAAADFDRMLAEQRPDRVIVTSMDRTHHLYICRALESGCDVISEKPMTVDAEKCQQIIDTVKRTGRHLTVTFNYRYSPRNSKIKELLASGIAGEITGVHFEWLLDTSHGADYFRRWHRCKRNSGGLLVHKATHHFDLVNWWLDSSPQTVYAMGDLRFYGKENAEKRGVTAFYARARGSETAAGDPFALHVTAKDEMLNGLYYNCEQFDGYFRDQSVFGDGIDIEDNLAVMVRYANHTVMTYSLHAHAPWEGYRICFNGTKGRLEFNVVEKSYVSGHAEDFNLPGMRELEGEKKNLVPEIIFQPHWGKPQVIDYDQSDKGGHGGGDVRLLKDIFIGATDDPLQRAAGYLDGARSILTGIAANLSIRTGLPVRADQLVKF
jgi:predicted dehydrogenase